MEFVPIIGYENRYAINKLGQVKNIKTNKLLKPYTNGVGYNRIGLYDGTKKRSKEFYIHRLLAIHFIPNPLNKQFINHIDGNTQNNDLSNLEWCTKSENGIHAYKIGLNYTNPKYGEENKNSILTVDIVKDIRKRYSEGQRQIDISKQLGYGKCLISQIVRNKTWKHIN